MTDRTRANRPGCVHCTLTEFGAILLWSISRKHLTSTGLNRTELKLSTPQVKDRMGVLLCSSQMSTCWPQVANTLFFWWWSSPVKTVCKTDAAFFLNLIPKGYFNLQSKMPWHHDITTTAYFAQDRVQWLLFFSITRCLHFPLLDCFVVPHLWKTLNINCIKYKLEQMCLNIHLWCSEEQQYREEGGSAEANNHSPDETLVRLDGADAFTFGQTPHFHLRNTLNIHQCLIVLW